MGLFYVGCRVLNPVTSKTIAVRRLMVDTGAESTWIDATMLEAIGIERRKKDLQFQLANGQIVTRSVGYAVLTVDKSETVDEVVFAETGDLQLLGARALEGLNLQVDARRKRLLAAGPIVSAAAVPPRFDPGVQSRVSGAPKPSLVTCIHEPRTCRNLAPMEGLSYLRNQYSTIPYPTPAGSVVRAVWNAMNRPSVETTGFDALPPS